MFGLIKQVLIRLLCFSKSLAAIFNTLNQIKFISFELKFLMNILMDYSIINLQLI